MKELRCGDARPTPKEKEGVSAAHLVKWVNEEVKRPAKCQDFLELVFKFGLSDSPLLPVEHVSAVLSVQL